MASCKAISASRTTACRSTHSSGQLLVGLINGSFYALLSLGLAIIFGLLGIVNIAQGAFYMAGAFFSWMLLQWLGIGYWPSLILSPLSVAILGIIMERTMIFRVYGPDHMPGLLLTFGLLMVIQGMFVYIFGSVGAALSGSGRIARRLEFGLHVPAEIPRLDRRRVVDRSASRLGTSSKGRRSAARCAPPTKIRC